MTLDLVKQALLANGGDAISEDRTSLDNWASEWEAIGERVKLHRDYRAGKHRAELSDEMQAMLRITITDDIARFNNNYCAKVIDTENARLKLLRLETENKASNEWVNGVLAANRSDALQVDVHGAALTDAATTLLVSWDNEAGRTVLTHEPLWNGTNGMLLRFGAGGTLAVAIKVWRETTSILGDTTRITVYYPDRIERFVSADNNTPTPFSEFEGDTGVAPFADNGQPLGVPVIVFPNRSEGSSDLGQSELEDVIPLQDAENRLITSLIMAAELTAFQIKVASGFKLPTAGFAPGDVVEIPPGDKEDYEPRMYVLETGEVIPYIQAADWFINQIGIVSDTPLPETMGSSVQSGEALKQRESGLIAKVLAFQVKNGNRWEDVMTLAHRIESAFSSPPPTFERITAHWQKPEIRNDKEVIENAQVLADMGLFREALRQMAPVFNWDEDKINELLDEHLEQRVQNFDVLTTGNTPFPTFGQQPVPTGNGAT